jgi:hypothetical protein
MREPKDERDAQRPDEGRGKSGIDGTHVRDDGASAEASKLSRERRLESDAATCLATVSECANAAIRGQNVLDGAVREHHDLVDELRKSTELGNGRGKRRVLRIDLLRDEDDLGHL